jgi:hypothetical protein
MKFVNMKRQLYLYLLVPSHTETNSFNVFYQRMVLMFYTNHWSVRGILYACTRLDPHRMFTRGMAILCCSQEPTLGPHLLV